jgi:hypothetical protein
MQTFRSIAFTLTLCFALFLAVSAQVTKPHTFADGETIDAARQNANFDEIYSKALNRTGGTMTGALAGTSASFSGAVTVGTLNTFTFDQSVQSGASPTFSGTFIGSIPEANITDGAILARLAADETVSGTWTFSNALTSGAVDHTFGSVKVTTVGAASEALIAKNDNKLAFFGGSTGFGFYSSAGGNVATLDASGIFSTVGRINSATLQPGFLAYNSRSDAGLSAATIDFDTEVSDSGTNFAADTFTAPVTGAYLFCASVSVSLGDTSFHALRLVTSNRTYILDRGESAIGARTFNGCVIADMDASDTAHVTHTANTGTFTAVGAATADTYFSGRLMP